jgi:hypothetical protein
MISRAFGFATIGLTGGSIGRIRSTRSIPRVDDGQTHMSDAHSRHIRPDIDNNLYILLLLLIIAAGKRFFFFLYQRVCKLSVRVVSFRSESVRSRTRRKLQRNAIRKRRSRDHDHRNTDTRSDFNGQYDPIRLVGKIKRAVDFVNTGGTSQNSLWNNCISTEYLKFVSFINLISNDCVSLQIFATSMIDLSVKFKFK